MKTRKLGKLEVSALGLGCMSETLGALCANCGGALRPRPRRRNA